MHLLRTGLAVFFFSAIIFCGQAANLPSLVWPKNEMSLFENRVLFQWNAANEADSYTLQVATDPLFEEIIIEALTSSLELDTLLPQPYKPIYYWRVLAHLQDGSDELVSFVYHFRLFSPSSLENLVVWLSANSVITNPSGKIQQWTDLSGNNNHAIQNEESDQPEWIEDAINSQPAIHFNGNSHFLTADFNNIYEPPNSFFVVYNLESGGNNVLLDGADPSNRTMIDFTGNAIRAWSGSGIQYGEDSPFDFIFNTAIFDLSNSQLFKNGELKASGNTGSNGTSGLTIGNHVTLDRFFNGKIAEIIIYNKKITPEKRNDVDNYFRKKYFPEQYIEPLNLGRDIFIDYGFCPVEIEAGEEYQTYLWSTGDTTSAIEVSSSGLYSLTVTDLYGFESSDTIRVNFPSAKLYSEDTILCSGSSLEISTNLDENEDYSYLWSNGDTNSSVIINEPGDYWVTITDNEGCTAFSDTLSIILDDFTDTFSLGEDQELCSGETLYAIPGMEDPEGFSFLWTRQSDPEFTSEAPSIVIYETDTYFLTLTNENGCIAEDSIHIEIVGIAPDAAFTTQTEVCAGSSLAFQDQSTISGDDEIVDWYWEFGDDQTSATQNPEHTYSEPGTFYPVLTVTSAAGCSNFFSDTVTVLPTPQSAFSVSEVCVGYPVFFSDETIAPDEEEIMMWMWDFGDGNFSNEQNPEHIYSEAGTWHPFLTTTLENGCQSEYQTTIEVPDNVPNPGSFTLVYPKNGQFIYDLSQDFSWNFPDNGYGFKLEVSDSEDFENLLLSVNTQEQSVFQELPPKKEYFWRVKAWNVCRDTVQSQHNSFQLILPSKFEELKLWLSADSSVVLQNGKVQEWHDLSNYSHIAIQETPSLQPLWLEDALGGNPTISFDGAGDFLSVEELQISQPATLFMVWRSNSTSPYRGTMLDGMDPDQRFMFRTNLSNIESWTNDGSFSYEKNFPFDFLISTINYNGPLSALFENSVPKAQGTHGNTELNGLYIGKHSSLDRPFNGELAEIILFGENFTDQKRVGIENYLRKKYFPDQYIEPVNLGFDKSIAYGFCPITLDAGDRFESYLWSTGDTTQTIEAAEPGTYSVAVTDIFGFESSDSLEVRFPDIFLSHPDTLICQGDMLSIGLEGEVDPTYSFLWSNGSQQQQIEVSEAGLYELQVTDSLGCQLNLSVYVEVDMFPEIATLGDDRPFCMGDELGLLENGPQLALKAGEASQDFFRNYTYQWSTGATTPTIVIDEPGDYALTVTNPNGCVATDTVSLSFQGYAPEAAFEGDAVCPGEPMQFNDQSTLPEGNIVSWEWLFEDGGSSQEQHPEYLWETDPGIWNVELTVTTDSGCSGTVENDVQIWHLPDPAFAPLNACHGQEVSFSDQSTCPDGTPAQWEWSFYDPAGNLVHTSDQSNPDFSFPEPGNWELKLITTSTTGCSDSLQYNMNVRTSPDPAFEWTTACIGEPVHFTDQSSAPPWAYITSRQWDFGDGNTSDFNNPSHLYSEDGIFEVALTVQAINGCEITLTQPVTVHSQPEVDFVSSDLCLKEPFTFTDMSTVENSTIAAWDWNFGGKGSSNEQNPTFAFGETGQFGVRLAATSEAGCTDSLTKLVDVFPAPESSFTFYPRFGVSPLTITFNNETEGATGYLWNFGDGSEPVTTPNPQHTYTENGIYYPTLVAYSDMGCADTTYREIKVIPLSVDIAVTDVNYAIKDNFLEVSATLQNLGTLELDTLLLDMKLSGRSPIREKWTGLLRGGDITSYTFNASLPMRPGETYDYVCVEASIPGIPQDDNPDNDTYCKPFESAFRALPPRPNPAREFVEVGFVLPYEGQVEITFFDMYGNIIGSGKREYAPEGISFIKLSTAHLRPGTYFYRITFRESSEVKKFMKW